MENIIEALATGAPQNVEQICTAIATLVLAILAAFRRGKKVGGKP